MKKRTTILRILALLAVAGLALPWAGCVTAGGGFGGGPGIRKSKPFIIARSPRPYGWGYWSHPYMCKVGNAVTVVYNLSGDGGVNWEIQHTIDPSRDGPAFSPDGGQTWIVGATNLTPEQRRLASPIGQIECAEGTLSFSHVMSDGGLSLRWVDKDGVPGERFKASVALPEGISSPAWPSTRGVQLDDGTLLIPFYGWSGMGNPFSTFLMGSRNRGSSWSHFCTVATIKDSPWGSEGPCEPALTRTSDGKLICLMRTGGAGAESGTTASPSMLLSISEDQGKTWKHRRMAYPGVMPKIIRLRNGILVAAFGRPGNNVIFSHDEGLTWGNEFALSSAGAKTSGYCDIVEVSPNRVLAVYDAIDAPLSDIWLWEPVYATAVKGVFFDVTR